MKLLLLLLLCIPSLCSGMQCHISPWKFSCRGTDKYDHIYHFYEASPEIYFHDRSEYEVEVLGSNYTTIEKLMNLPLEHGAVIITKLTVRNSSVLNVNEDAFEELTSLWYLDLSQNSITDITFVLPTELLYLNLSHNLIKVIDFNAVMADQIDFSYNVIDELKPSFVYHQYSNANLSNNKIMELKEPDLNCLFQNLNVDNNVLNAVVLTDGYHNIISLKENTINSFKCNPKTRTSIKKLDLTHSVFYETNPNIKKVYMFGNNFTTLKALDNSVHLEELHVTFIGTLETNSFKNAYIRKLYLVNSDINSIQEDSFIGMFNLKELHFLGTNVYNIQSRAFNGLFNVVFLDSQNIFKHTTLLANQTFYGLRKLSDLDLSNLQIQIIEADAFLDLINLKSLNLTNNSLTDLEKSTFSSLPTLMVLDLSHNQISFSRPQTFENLNNLTVLYLQNNNFSKLWSGTFEGLVNLEELHLEKNHLQAMSKKVFSNLKRLRYLYLQNNYISGIGNYFNNLYSLHVLFLYNNTISYVSKETFEGLGDLRKLRLDHNIIVYFNADILSNLPSLESVDISNNSIENFDFLNDIDDIQVISDYKYD